MQAPQDLNVSPAQGDALMERLERDACTPEGRQLLVHVLRLYVWLIYALQESKLRVKRLRIMLFGQPKNTQQHTRVPDAARDVGTAGAGQVGNDVAGEEGEATAAPPATLTERAVLTETMAAWAAMPIAGPRTSNAIMTHSLPVIVAPLCGYGT